MKEGVAAASLSDVDLDAAAVREYLDSQVAIPVTSTLQTSDTDVSPSAKAVLLQAGDIAKELGTLAGWLVQDMCMGWRCRVMRRL